MRFRAIPSEGQPFDHEQEVRLTKGATFFHPPREPGTHGFYKVTSVEASDDQEVHAVVRVVRVAY
jgi:hypothetical protein